MPRLKEKYTTEVASSLKERFGIENDHAVPRLSKIVINMGVKGAGENKAMVEAAARDRLQERSSGQQEVPGAVRGLGILDADLHLPFEALGLEEKP